MSGAKATYSNIEEVPILDVENVCGDGSDSDVQTQPMRKQGKRWWKLASGLAMFATVVGLVVFLFTISAQKTDNSFPVVDTSVCTMGDSSTCFGKYVHSLKGEMEDNAPVCGDKGVVCECIAVTRITGNMLKSTSNTCLEAGDAASFDRPREVVRGSNAALKASKVTPGEEQDGGRQASMQDNWRGRKFVWNMAARR